ncbi:hypothetical protein PQG02_00170 (plasmid) [Nostoc sp. UHCC 0926]|nr:hypothetical protein PQG02_00170 [Nostoc sp. UHCC 0926]
MKKLSKLFFLFLPLSLLNACVQVQGQSVNNNQPQGVPVKLTTLKMRMVEESSDFIANLNLSH